MSVHTRIDELAANAATVVSTTEVDRKYGGELSRTLMAVVGLRSRREAIRALARAESLMAGAAQLAGDGLEFGDDDRDAIKYCKEQAAIALQIARR